MIPEAIERGSIWRQSSLPLTYAGGKVEEGAASLYTE
jgi:hypothetical protein